MNLHKIKISGRICMLIILLCACTAKKSDIVVNDNLQSLNIEGVHTFLTYDGESILYQSLSDNKAVYSRYYINDEKTVRIGEIINPILIGRSKTLSNNSLYFYATEYTNDQNEETVNNLYRIAFNDNSLEKIGSNTISECLIPIDSYNDHLLSLKVDVDNSGIGSSILESLNLKTGDTTVILENTADYINKQGNAIVNFSLGNESIYVYSQTANGALASSIKVYDMEGEEKNVLSLSTLPQNDLLETSMEIKVFGDLLYLSSISNNVFIGKITDTGIHELLQGNDVEYAHEYSGFPKVYYKRFSSNIYMYNEQTQKFEENQLNLEGEEKIRCIFTSGNDLLIITITDDNQEKIYTTEMSDLLTSINGQ